jgi:hypothetical protein
MLSVMEFIFDLFVSLDKRLYSDINNYIFYGVGWMGGQFPRQVARRE